MKKRKRIRRLGLLFLLLAAALALTGIYYDLDWIRQDEKAGNRSQEILSGIENVLNGDAGIDLEKEISAAEQKIDEEKNQETLPAERKGMEMGDILDAVPGDPVHVSYNGQDCIAVLSIPDLSLKLPVIDTEVWDPALMDYGPVRYEGSIKNRDLILMAHNWENHFRSILSIPVGTNVFLTTFDHRTYVYQVTETVSYHRSQKQKLYEGIWDLTLFTCVPQTYNRMSVRCCLVQIINQTKGDF